MFKRMIQGISQLFTARGAVTLSDSRDHLLKRCPINRSTDNELTADCRSQTQLPQPSFPSPRPRGNGHRYPQLQDGPPSHHSAARLLRDGRLQIGITGFNDAAFNISIMSRHDAPQLAAAITDLPCRVKMVADRNIAEGLLAALRTLSTSDAGRCGIMLVTSGDSSCKEEWMHELAKTVAHRRIGIHVICLGPKSGDLMCGPRINTKNILGYGGFRVVETGDQFLVAVRDAFVGLTPAFGMRGTNKAVVLLDCSEAMVESYRNTTRIEMVMASLQTFLKDPLIRSHCLPETNSPQHRNYHSPRSMPSAVRAASVSALSPAHQWVSQSA